MYLSILGVNLVLSESWLKDKHPCFDFVKVHVRDKGSLRKRLMMIKTKNQKTLGIG